MKPYENTSLSAEERANSLVSEMTVEECAEQLRYDAPSIPRLGIPSYNWWNEALHGVARAGTATMFPQAIGLAATFDRELLHSVGEIIGVEGRAKYNAASAHNDRDIYKGLTFWSPNINIFRDPRWGRGHETYGEDPYLTGECGVAFVKGIQGDGPVMRAAACAKHLAVHSGPEPIRHSFNAHASKKDIEETYLPAFETLVKEAKVEGVMGAYNLINGEPSCASPMIQAHLKKWGFEGYFVSDCGAIANFHESHHITSNAVESAAMALKGGCDVNCGCTYANVLAAYEEGLVSEEDIRVACRHLFRTRFRLGMLDGKTPYDDIPYSVVACTEHKKTALEAAEKSAVLLKNNGILPIDTKKVRTIAVVGPNADSRVVLQGNYYGTPDRFVTFLEGIEDRFDGRVLYAEGCNLTNPRPDGLSQEYHRISEAVSAAENADLIIACVGLDATIEGEQGDASNEFGSGDKSHLRLPTPQRFLMEKLKETGKPLVILLASGSSVNPETDCDALLEMWYPGQTGGTAAAALLFGDVSPCGKLPVTFYETVDMLPEFTDYSMQNRTYRYTRENILYPFGFGLTYGDIQTTAVAYDSAAGIASVTVRNFGKSVCRDTVELWMADNSPCATKYPALCGFVPVELEAGEEKILQIPVKERAFTSVDEEGVRAIRGTRYTLYAGTHQPDQLSAQLSGTECVSCIITK